MLAQAAEPCGVNWVTSRLIYPSAEETNSPRPPLRPRTPWRNEQHRSSRYELPPLHPILIAGLRTMGTEYQVSMVVALTAGANASKCSMGAQQLWVLAV